VNLIDEILDVGRQRLERRRHAGNRDMTARGLWELHSQDIVRDLKASSGLPAAPHWFDLTMPDAYAAAHGHGRPAAGVEVWSALWTRGHVVARYEWDGRNYRRVPFPEPAGLPWAVPTWVDTRAGRETAPRSWWFYTGDFAEALAAAEEVHHRRSQLDVIESAETRLIPVPGWRGWLRRLAHGLARGR
jgi:hypothetical protein